MDKHEQPVVPGPDPRSRAHDLLSGALGVFAGFLLVSLNWHIDQPAADYPFYKGPKIFPVIVLSLMFIFAIPSIFRLIRPLRDSEWQVDGYGWPKKPSAITLILVAFFLFGIPVIGLEASVFLFMVLAFPILGYRSIGVNVIYPVIYTTIIVFIFKYALKIWFAEPLVNNLFGN
jgi:hypothetical protein